MFEFSRCVAQRGDLFVEADRRPINEISDVDEAIDGMPVSDTLQELNVATPRDWAMSVADDQKPRHLAQVNSTQTWTSFVATAISAMDTLL